MTDEAFEIGKSIWEAQTCARSKRMRRRKEGVLVQGSSARAPGQAPTGSTSRRRFQPSHHVETEVPFLSICLCGKTVKRSGRRRNESSIVLSILCNIRSTEWDYVLKTILISSSRSLSLHQVNKSDHKTWGNALHKWGPIWTLILHVKLGASMVGIRRNKTQWHSFMGFSLSLNFLIGTITK